ncbi:MAG: carbamoyltransferase [Verrucomicrobiaceae bacterium]|nr:carbamoyltransferase [Verrucomicrobiaceae bacterium]
MHILGLSAFYHDSAACLLSGGHVVAAAQEERFSRRRHDSAFPCQAVEFCLKRGGLRPQDLDAVAFYDKPLLKFDRILETHLAWAPQGLKSFMMAVPVWLAEKLWMPSVISKEVGNGLPLLFAEHHESHAASAFFPSPFESAAVLTVDGVGEWATSSYGVGRGNKVEMLKEMHFPHSLGLLYSAFTYYTGFKVNSGEYKVMGLAPYGEPKYAQAIFDHLIDLKDDGSFAMNQEYFDYCAGLKMTAPKMEPLFGGPPRRPESNLTQREMDLAASVQVVTEEIMLRMARHIRKETGERHLCLAGGVALNCVANGKLLRAGVFDDIYIQPAAGDAGGALGAALSAYHHYHDKPRVTVPGTDWQRGSYLGPEYSDDEVASAISPFGAKSTLHASDEAMCAEVARLMTEGKVVGWFQGRMEFGPRALGARSIIGDARSPEMQKIMNLKIKFRESFRPFAPAVLAEKVGEWFDHDRSSPYMLLVADVLEKHRKQLSGADDALWGIDKLNIPRSTIPAVTHVDCSARLQTVHRDTNPNFHRLISEFDRLTGCPVVVNTSFNVRGEPIVENPAQAYTCFMRTEMDVLVLGRHVLLKSEQPEWKEAHDWRSEHTLD